MTQRKVVLIIVIILLSLAGWRFVSNLGKRAPEVTKVPVSVEVAFDNPQAAAELSTAKKVHEQNPSFAPIETSSLAGHVSLQRTKEIQRALESAGFDPGPIDGKYGSKTKRAVKQFQKANGLVVDGKVGPKTWAKLSKYLE